MMEPSEAHQAANDQVSAFLLILHDLTMLLPVR
jgi:hypothetical protein